MDKEFFGYISLFFAFMSYAPYMWATWRGTNRPHVFGWVIWTIVMFIGTAGQYAGGAGPGAWSTTFTGISCLIITLLALRQGDKNITYHDVIVLVVALSAIPIWMMTENPFTAILIVTFIDLLGYLPTLRKAYHKPHEEMAMSYLITNFKHFAGFFAMSTYSWTTMLYPASLFVANWVLVILVYYWRYKQGKTPSELLKNFPDHPN
jgi:hypothetical protein